MGLLGTLWKLQNAISSEFAKLRTCKKSSIVSGAEYRRILRSHPAAFEFVDISEVLWIEHQRMAVCCSSLDATAIFSLDFRSVITVFLIALLILADSSILSDSCTISNLSLSSNVDLIWICLSFEGVESVSSWSMSSCCATRYNGSAESSRQFSCFWNDLVDMMSCNPDQDSQ